MQTKSISPLASHHSDSGGQDGKPAPNHLKLISTMFQNMFPSININKIAVGDIRRCLLLRYDAETDQIHLRHYSIKAVPVGESFVTPGCIY